MEQRYHNTPSNSGFLLGFLLGVILTLLLVTSKGRKILKMLTEEGIDKMEDLEQLFKEKMADRDSDMAEEEISGNDFVTQDATPVQVAPAVLPSTSVQSETMTHLQHVHHVSEHTSIESEPHIHRIKPSPRRFFKGVPKKN